MNFPIYKFFSQIQIFLYYPKNLRTIAILALCSRNVVCKPHFGDRMFRFVRVFPQSLQVNYGNVGYLHILSKFIIY